MSNALQTLTRDRLVSLLLYDKETGEIKWRETGAGRRRNKVAGSKDSHGYIQTRIDGRMYFNHRLAWIFAHGDFPKDVIDHIDGNILNNRIDNLRDVCRKTNQENQRSAPVSNKTTGLLGATLHKGTGKFMAKIQVNRKQVYLGLFTTAEAAHAEYVKAKRHFHIGATI